MKLSELLQPAQIRVPLESADKQSVLREMVQLLDVPDESGRSHIYDAVVDRERIMSTGIGGGVAIPHGKCGAIQGVHAAFGVTERPIDFDAIDGEPVRLCFLIVSEPHTTGPHIRVLSQISNLLNQPECKNALLRAETAEQVLEIFVRWEADT